MTPIPRTYAASAIEREAQALDVSPAALLPSLEGTALHLDEQADALRLTADQPGGFVELGEWAWETTDPRPRPDPLTALVWAAAGVIWAAAVCAFLAACFAIWWGLTGDGR